MKVVCTRSNISNLTLNKVYDVLKVSYNDDNIYNKLEVIYCYSILNDFGLEYRYPSNRFITIEEYRDNKLNEILNDRYKVGILKKLDDLTNKIRSGEEMPHGEQTSELLSGIDEALNVKKLIGIKDESSLCKDIC